MPFAVLVVPWRCSLSWEWGRLVHGREADVVIAVHDGGGGAAGILAAVGFVGLGLLALPIGAILAMLLSLGRNSLFSALGVFYAGLPAVALIWLRSDAALGLAGGDLPDRRGRHLGHGGLPRGPAAGRAQAVAARFAQQDLGGPRSAPWSPARSSAPFSGLRFRRPPRCRLAATGAVLSFVAQAGDLAEFAHETPFRRQGLRARSSPAMAASWIASTVWWRRRRRSAWPPSSSMCIRPRTRFARVVRLGGAACRHDACKDGWRRCRRRLRAGAAAPKRITRARRHGLGRHQHARSDRPQPAPVRGRGADRPNATSRRWPQCALRHRAELAVVADASRYGELKERLAGSGIEVAAGAAALIEAAERPADCVMAGISGAAGLRPDAWRP